MAAIFTEEWAAQAAEAINAFPDDAYRETKLFLYWDWIDAARKGFDGTLALGMHTPDDGSRYATFVIEAGQVTGTGITDSRPEATFVLAGDLETWKDMLDGYDAGKAVMYRRIRLEEGDVFRFFNRIYFFTESLVALSKVPAEVP
jgi:putative sterol carrier protein